MLINDIQYEGSNKLQYKILNVEAWPDGQGSWQWDAWQSAGVIDAETSDTLTDAELIQWFVDNGYLKESALKDCSIDNDGYNLSIIRTEDKYPLFAIEYGGF